MSKHFIWAISLMVITFMLCCTVLYINYNSWTVRFEMDNNTKEAIESVEYPIANINEQPENICYSEICRIDIKNNIQIGGCSMSKVDCKLWEDKYGFALEVQNE